MNVIKSFCTSSAKGFTQKEFKKKDDDKVPSRRDFRSYAVSLVVDYLFVVLPVLLILTV